MLKTQHNGITIKLINLTNNEWAELFDAGLVTHEEADAEFEFVAPSDGSLPAYRTKKGTLVIGFNPAYLKEHPELLLSLVK